MTNNTKELSEEIQVLKQVRLELNTELCNTQDKLNDILLLAERYLCIIEGLSGRQK